MADLQLYNTLTRKKEVFTPQAQGQVGLYVCGPTVYGDAHLGHARSALTFDLLVRWLRFNDLGVNYVRNITDVGHLVGDADEGEDKIQKKAKAEQLDPYAIARRYTERYQADMAALGCLVPDHEPRATAHIAEQIALTEKILAAGYAYEANGSVYFDLEKYQKTGKYGELSGRVYADLLSNSRELEGQDEKRNPLDFALWKKASPSHLMQWPSPWSQGFPGWHLECTAMSGKYLGDRFDIHGGGMDLQFPHHECEIAQSTAACGQGPANYWVHNNLVTIDGQKMAKSLGNFITLEELFAGQHERLTQGFSPMNVRFFILQAHYRSTLDFSETALEAARKGYRKLMNAVRAAQSLTGTPAGEDAKISEEVLAFAAQTEAALRDDLNTAIALSHLFGLTKVINRLDTGQLPVAALSPEAYEKITAWLPSLVETVLGLKDEMPDDLLPFIAEHLKTYQSAKAEKDYAAVDEIRAALRSKGVLVRDFKHKIDWAYEEQ